MKKLLIADDEPAIINFIKMFFEAKGYKVIGAGDGIQLINRLDIIPDIIILDIMMPGLDGIETCRQIRDRVDCPIVFLTAKTEQADLMEGLMAGGDDYIMKPFSVEELFARVEAHLRREERNSQPVTRRSYGRVWIDYSSRNVGVDNETIVLARKEYDILELLSNNRGQVFTKERIYENIWGYDAEGDAATSVTEHVKRIRKKFEYTGINPVFTVWGVGYKWMQ